jgi:uncharacterized membrane protein
MSPVALPEFIAFAWFVLAWAGYSWVVERTSKGRVSLNALMNECREQWMLKLIARENRIVDAQVIAALQNGTAFFASTSLIAIGGTLSLLRAPEAILPVISALPFGSVHTRELWELKMMGLAVILVYAFFKFAWSYRLYNYFAILLGAAPLASEHASPHARAFARRSAQICDDAGRHFNRGQRAFFFALGYLGWFLGAVPLAITTAAVLVVMWRRQYASDARKAFDAADLAEASGG